MLLYPEKRGAAFMQTTTVLALSSLAMTGSLDFSPARSKPENQIRPIPETLLFAKPLGRALATKSGVKLMLPSLKTPNVPVSFTYQPKPSHHSPTHHSPLHPPVHARPLPVILRRIGGCESGGGSPYAKIKYHISNFEGSSASGGFQIEDETWANFDNYPRALDAPARAQNAKAEQLLHEDGTDPWTASESCWEY